MKRGPLSRIEKFYIANNRGTNVSDLASELDRRVKGVQLYLDTLPDVGEDLPAKLFESASNEDSPGGGCINDPLGEFLLESTEVGKNLNTDRSNDPSRKSRAPTTNGHTSAPDLLTGRETVLIESKIESLGLAELQSTVRAISPDPRPVVGNSLPPS